MIIIEVVFLLFEFMPRKSLCFRQYSFVMLCALQFIQKLQTHILIETYWVHETKRGIGIKN